MADDPSFMQTERQRAARWKETSPTLPDAARVPAPYLGPGGRGPDVLYPFCLPAEYATLSLLPEVRESALALFAELEIPWHAGVDGGPGNHLLSSQVQCVNALGQMVHDPNRLVRAFGPVVGTVQVLEIEPGRWLTFEYIGDTDYFNEAPNGQRTRGANCTSVDAAFLHRTANGLVELVLVEWKYTESYRRRTIDPAKDEVRWQRYGAALEDSDGPVRSEVLAFSDLLDEPLYQLMRQQLLAHSLEQDRAHGADRVRVMHVHPASNLAYQYSLHRDSQWALGATVAEVWAQLLRRPDRYVEVDNAVFLDPEITSTDYVARYGPIPADSDPDPASGGAARPASRKASVVARRTAFNDDTAPAIADQLGFPPRWADPALSSRFAFFADDTQLAVIAGPQEGDHVELALAHAIRHAAGRTISLVLPWDRFNATAQRIPWLGPDARPTLYALDDNGQVTLVAERTRPETIQVLLDRLDGDTPDAELARASTPLHLGDRADCVRDLVECLTRDPRLDHAHRKGERSWHYAGQRVVSIRRSRTGLRITAGIHYTGDNAPDPIELPAGAALTDTQRAAVLAAVETAITERRTGSFHQPDEAWLQSIIRRTPSIVGVEQPALRELPAWRPRDKPDGWGRGFIDLVGLDGHGNIRIVETKLATNPDDLLVLQGLDYLVWAHAYEHALRNLLGAPRDATFELHLVLGADPADGTVNTAPCTEPLAAALDPDAVRWRFRTVHDWFITPNDTVDDPKRTGGVGWFDVERVDPPRNRHDADLDVAQDVFGEQAEWGYAIPWMHQVLTEPRAGHSMPRAPQPGDDLPEAVGYWSALLHLLVYGFGWARPDVGLRWWYDAGKPIDDPRLALLAEIWDADDQLDWFAAWLWTSSDTTCLPEADHNGERPRVDIDGGWLSEVERQIRDSGTPAPYGGDGGSDPLHLGYHIDGPLQHNPATAAQVSRSATGNRATLITSSMTGWYRALLNATDGLAGHTVDVVAEPVGLLGTYRHSPATGLWYAGAHDLHLRGNPTQPEPTRRRSERSSRRDATRFAPTELDAARPLVAGLVELAGDCLVADDGHIPPGRLQLVVTATGVSLRTYSPIAKHGTLSLLASPGRQTSVHFPAFDKLHRYLVDHEAEIERYADVLLTLGCDLRAASGRSRPTLPLDLVVDHLDTIAPAAVGLAPR